MYKKFALFLTLFSTLTNYINCSKNWLEVKPGYFFFTTTPMKKIYKHGGAQVQASLSSTANNYFDLYTSIGWRKTHGNALNSGERTDLMVIPIDLGIKPVFNFNEKYYYFFTFGPRFFYMQQKNYSAYVDYKVKGGGIGLFINTGFNLSLSDGWLLGLLGEYSYEKENINPKMQNVFSEGNTQIGGFMFGISLGRTF